MISVYMIGEIVTIVETHFGLKIMTALQYTAV